MLYTISQKFQRTLHGFIYEMTLFGVSEADIRGLEIQ